MSVTVYVLSVAHCHRTACCVNDTAQIGSTLLVCNGMYLNCRFTCDVIVVSAAFRHDHDHVPTTRSPPQRARNLGVGVRWGTPRCNDDYGIESLTVSLPSALCPDSASTCPHSTAAASSILPRYSLRRRSDRGAYPGAPRAFVPATACRPCSLARCNPKYCLGMPSSARAYHHALTDAPF